ncbi:hypothetical protein BDD43_1689 [Mucilaginibacter gracilis]|uniref:Uncharacterized protein n=1 Tax=Mucilaginibacter gracilis TaxID=423350 RepID=A0A495IYA5_9SPHI|nr:contact-dependent growth inhibition system immunity protein [Mucilaginibacter gracilis]RKR81542.1 hypothetical protein BDD43_1689 [Mucilaginibacter gracilis]
MRRPWGNSIEASTSLIKRCIDLSRIPISDFSVEDLRLMIGQQEGLRYLIPVAIEILSYDLFAEGDFYPGDLLNSVLDVDFEFWKKNKVLWQQVNQLILGKEEELRKERISASKFSLSGSPKE